ncbi:MAG: response regulator [Lachnospiraceae bacterium]|nr:response regulator [Lachnospiraceae bacterium]
MELRQRIYSVLLITAAGNIDSALGTLLSDTFYDPVKTVRSISAARRACNERSFDIVIVNSPLPDDPGIRFAEEMSGEHSAVLLIVRSELYEGIYDRVVDHGVFVLSRPTSRSVLARALSWLASARERLRHTEKKELSIEEKMEEIRLVNRAKWLLISEIKMDEPKAHRYIEKQAMDRCVSRSEIAREIIRTYT